MWNAWTAPPGALPRDFDPWSCEAHCARCGELAQDCHCEDEEGEMSEQHWQPIESAPKDRGFLIAYNANRKTYGIVCWWPGGGWNGEGCWGWLNENIAWSRQRGNQPTHWMPLPAAPGEEHTNDIDDRTR